MKTLAILIPVQLSDGGMLQIKNFRSLKQVVGFLKDCYEITLIVQTHGKKTAPEIDSLEITVHYDNIPQKMETAPTASRFQTGYYRWASRDRADMGEKVSNSAVNYDCLIAWDGCSLWCLAMALECVVVKRRLLWLHDDPDLYLMKTDHTFYAGLCGQFDFIIAPDEKIERSLANIYGSNLVWNRLVKLQLPVDVSWYWEQAEQPLERDFRSDEINLLAVSRMSVESDFEKLPGQLAQLLEQYPSLHCYLMGEGERLDHYIQQVALYDVDTVFSFLGAQDNPYPYLSACDALIVSGSEKATDMEMAVEVFGIRIISLDELSRMKWKKKEISCAKKAFIWQDSEKLMDILEGVTEK